MKEHLFVESFQQLSGDLEAIGEVELPVEVMDGLSISSVISFCSPFSSNIRLINYREYRFSSNVLRVLQQTINANCLEQQHYTVVNICGA